MIHPESGERLVRETRPIVFETCRCPGYSETVMLTGWYPALDGFPILVGADLDAFNAAIRRMKDAIALRRAT